MAKYEIRIYGDKVLRKKAKSINIEKIDSEIKDLIYDMIEVMRENKGIGLAAPQIGISKRIFVIDTEYLKISPEKGIIINPEIEESSEDINSHEEGCLSVPNVYAPVKRPIGIKYSYYTIEGKKVRGEDNSFWARVFQHELDHLDGILFIDKVDRFNKLLIKNKLAKLKRMNRKQRL